MSHALQIFLAYHPRNLGEPRLIVARSREQAELMTQIGWTVKIATRFEAYRFGKCGVPLEYATPKCKTKETT